MTIIYTTYELSLVPSSRHLVIPHYGREANMCESLQGLNASMRRPIHCDN